MYSTNSICNVNKFVLNDNILDLNDKVIKELASELEQSTNKKDILTSNAKKIEDNFKAICNKISPLNLNKNNDQKENTSIKSIINENDEDMNNNLNNINIPENIKINTISTEKTEEIKVWNSNNICLINNNQNDYNYNGNQIPPNNYPQQQPSPNIYDNNMNNNMNYNMNMNNNVNNDININGNSSPFVNINVNNNMNMDSRNQLNVNENFEGNDDDESDEDDDDDNGEAGVYIGN